jgi:hypothetical protein
MILAVERTAQTVRIVLTFLLIVAVNTRKIFPMEAPWMRPPIIPERMIHMPGVLIHEKLVGVAPSPT